jgi:protein-L-isoaspartate(D-aspartate) O-methyltransferase
VLDYQEVMQFIDTYKHKGMRKALLNALIHKEMIAEKVIKAMEKVPRHFFLDSAFLEQAYLDKAFSIGEGQTISQPSTVAFQTELLDVQAGDKILEIGTGSGYQSCILLELGAILYTIEYNKKLHQQAKNILNQIGYKANFICGDGSQGLARFAPFDKIIVTAGAPKVPQTLVEQLKNGGVMVIPVGDNEVQQMYKIQKTLKGEIIIYKHESFSFVPLLGKEGWKL